jgi:hypothetical protein
MPECNRSLSAIDERTAAKAGARFFVKDLKIMM